MRTLFRGVIVSFSKEGAKTYLGHLAGCETMKYIVGDVRRRDWAASLFCKVCSRAKKVCLSSSQGQEIWWRPASPLYTLGISIFVFPFGYIAFYLPCHLRLIEIKFVGMLNSFLWSLFISIFRCKFQICFKYFVK